MQALAAMRGIVADGPRQRSDIEREIEARSADVYAGFFLRAILRKRPGRIYLPSDSLAFSFTPLLHPSLSSAPASPPNLDDLIAYFASTPA